MNQITDQPIPQGKYLPAVRHNDLIYSSGMTPRKAGKLLYSGQIRTDDLIEIHKEAVQLSALNALTAAEGTLEAGEKITAILQLNVYLNTEIGFTAHPKIADFASEFLTLRLGPNSIGSRAAIGVASLPSDAPVEISIIAKVN